MKLKLKLDLQILENKLSNPNINEDKELLNSVVEE